MKTLGWIVLFSILTGMLVFGAMGGFDRQPAVISSEKKPLTSEPDFRNKLAEIRMNKDKLQRAIKKLETRRDENIQYLREKGITKVADAKGDANAEMALTNLKGWSESIQELSGQLDKYDSAISRIDAMLKKLERDQINAAAGLTEEEEIELLSIVKDLNDRLGVGQNDVLKDAEMDALLNRELNRELGKSSPSP